MSRSRLALLAAVALSAACGSASPAPPEPPTPPPGERRVLERTLTGAVALQGATLPITLQIYGPPGELLASLSVPALDLTANGGGEWRNGELRLELSYGSDCAGTVRMEGRGEFGDTRVEGRFNASDCTGSEEGTFTIRAQS